MVVDYHFEYCLFRVFNSGKVIIIEITKMNKLFKFVGKIFYTFLDISGILLGIFLMVAGLWVKGGKPMADWMGWIAFALGVSAFLIHVIHFIVSKKKGSEYFYTTRQNS